MRKLMAALVAVALTGCGGDDAEPAAPRAPAGDLGDVKSYLLDHTARLERQTAALAADADAYHGAAEAAGFDYARLLDERRPEVRALVRRMQATFREANPAYEEMEGVVAGVPALADFDVVIDAGGDKSDPENAVPFSIRTPAGRTFELPGNFFFLTETAL